MRWRRSSWPAAAGTAQAPRAQAGPGEASAKIVQTKDVNSSLNVLQAGNGGESTSATGGAGGSVTGVQTVGLIGQASDDRGHGLRRLPNGCGTRGAFTSLFPDGVPQGVFAGRGVEQGVAAGVAGSVTSISAAEIAAIGAAADANGLFAAANKVANITAQVIGYDKNGNGLYANVSGTNTTPPSQAVAIDGFIFSHTASVGVNTSENTVLKNFTFVGSQPRTARMVLHAAHDASCPALTATSSCTSSAAALS